MGTINRRLRVNGPEIGVCAQPEYKSAQKRQVRMRVPDKRTLRAAGRQKRHGTQVRASQRDCQQCAEKPEDAWCHQIVFFGIHFPNGRKNDDYRAIRLIL